MGRAESKMPVSSKFLVLLHFLLGIGAVFGGLVFVIDPTGGIIQMPVTVLKNSPFASFFIPGLILFLVLGLLPLLVAYALVTQRELKLATRLNLFAKMHWAWTYSFYVSFALIIWITVEAYYLQTMMWAHVLYIFWALAIQALTLLPRVQRHYVRF